MPILDKINDKEKSIQKTIDIDEDLYQRLNKVAKTKFNQTTSKLINACIFELAETENMQLYKNEGGIQLKHTVMFSKEALETLEKLKKKYNIPTCKLIGIAINNVIEEIEK